MTTAPGEQRGVFGLRPGDRALVISPHPDDETIGPGGTIARLAAEDVEVHVLCVTVRAAKMWGSSSEPSVRYAEFDKACAALGVASSTIAWVDETGELDISTRQRALVDLIERNEEVSLASVRPQLLLIPSAGGFHQDHQAVHRAAFAAARCSRRASSPRRASSSGTAGSEDRWSAENESWWAHVDTTRFWPAKEEALRAYGITTTPRVVGGLTPACAERAVEFYRQVTVVHRAKGMREAEAAKILENTYRQVNIALVNEFAQLCHSMDIDVWDTITAASTKPYGFASFKPGAGVGGHCIPADPLSLVHRDATMGLPFHMAETAHQVNEGMPLWVADRVAKDLDASGNPLDSATVLLLGVTYKADTADTRHTPAVPIAAALLRRGIRVVFHDPYADELVWPDDRIEGVSDLGAALAGADMTVLLQRHKEYTQELLAGARRLFDTTGTAPLAEIAL
ncbi:nucleotide sugar dehydrogenase [Streptomyces cyaneofuscatus]|uniref:nucleotide sugar dehydrogenase n=1 Tax=Streptomyces cyaneofuscatus TaxID=66883 RepID=UPI0034418CB4